MTPPADDTGVLGAAATLALPPELSSVGKARRFVAQRCDVEQVSPPQRGDVLLLTSELVTNAVLHGRSEVCVEVVVVREVLRVSVLDENSRRPLPLSEDVNALDGRGLALVDAVAARWGVEDRPSGKAVWFELACR